MDGTPLLFVSSNICFSQLKNAHLKQSPQQFIALLPTPILLLLPQTVGVQTAVITVANTLTMDSALIQSNKQIIQTIPLQPLCYIIERLKRVYLVWNGASNQLLDCILYTKNNSGI